MQRTCDYCISQNYPPHATHRVTFPSGIVRYLCEECAGWARAALGVQTETIGE